MTVYFTKTWGFDEPCGPLHFSEEGWRKKAQKQLKPGDLVLVVGTQGKETQSQERGVVLGIMEPTTEPIFSSDYDLKTRPIDYDEEGKFRWPFGLINKRAWRIPGRHSFNEITKRKFLREGSRGIEPLTEEEATAALQLPRKEVGLLLPIRARARVEGEAVARRRASPPPTTTRRGVMHMRQASAYTYVMVVEGARTVAFKIGWAFEHSRRRKEFNQAAMPALGGVEYKTRLHRLWDSAREAYRMEQWLLRKFNNARHPDNHEILVGV